MTASDDTSAPLLSAFNDASSKTQPKDQSAVSLRSLEDGSSASDSESECGDLRKRQRQGSFWRRLRMSLRRRNGRARHGDVRLGGGVDEKRRRRWRWRTYFALPVLVLCFFGVLHIFNFLFGYFPLFWDDTASSSSSLDWTIPGKSSQDIASHLLDITRGVTPVPCHSHNDYWRRVPLYDALRWGCTGVEADVWLFDDELFVGHSTNALTQNRTFRSMYVDPLVAMLDHKNENNTSSPPTKNGIFDTEPQQTLVLLVDFKNDGRDIFPYVSQHLSALREKGYLTYFNGDKTIERAITVVATGNAPFDMITANTTYRDIFFDAPLASLYLDPSSSSPSKLSPRGGGQGTVGTLPTSHFDSTNSYYASVDFRRAIGFVWWGSLSSKQLNLVRGQIQGAKERGLKARYWSTPKWPVGLRNRVWRMLVKEGAGYLNGDDLGGMVGILRGWGG